MFGEEALRAGYITERDLERALAIQRERDIAGESHKLLGIILLELGAISSDQLIDLLRKMDASFRSGRSP